ncbi:MAG: hypothetical protein ACLUE2_09760 [Bacteroides cellulosilyticus]
MNGDLRVSFKPVPATNYARMTVSVNGTRFRMTLKHIIPSGFQEELMSLSSTLFRIYKESLLQHKPITAKELKKQFTTSTPSLLYDTIYRSCTSHFLSIGKTISFEQYQFQLKTIKSIPIFCQLTYGIPEISILALPDTFLDQLEAFFANHSTEKHRSREQVQLIRTILLKEYRKGNIKLSDPLNQQLTLHNILEELTPEDVFYLQEVHLPCHYAAIRDIFIFSCFTGLNYASIKQLTCRQLRTMSDGSLWLFLKRNRFPYPTCRNRYLIRYQRSVTISYYSTKYQRYN